MIKLLFAPLFLVVLILFSGSAVLAYGIKRDKRREIKTGFIILLSGAILLYILSLSPVANSMAWMLEKQYVSTEEVNPAAIYMVTVLGGGLYRQDRMRHRPELSSTSYTRVLCGVEMFRRYNARYIVMQGGFGSADSDVSVAQVMKEVAMTFGISGEQIIIEEKSENTFEHPIELHHITGEQGRNMRIGLVTSAWHMPRAVAAFSRSFNRILPFPCDPISASSNWSIRSILPSIDAFDNSTIVFQEFIGLAWYKVKWHFAA